MWKLATAQPVLGQPGHQLSLGSEKLHAAWMLAPGVDASLLVWTLPPEWTLILCMLAGPWHGR